MHLNEEIYLGRALRMIRRWEPGAYEIWMPEYRKDSGLYQVETRDEYVSVIFTLREHGIPQLIQLVFQDETVISDCAAYLLKDSDLEDERLCRELEEESDWLYWETEIAREETDRDETSRVLLYTNAYTTRTYRRQGLFLWMIGLMERYVSMHTDINHLYSVISLDPDVACYGPDRQTEPYYYSMKDEPTRLLNAEIIRKAGFEPFKLETDEPVEDGSILWFAFKKTTFVLI